METDELVKIRLFKGIAPDEFETFLSTTPSSSRNYQKGDFIALQGDICRSLYILCKGTVRTRMESEEGRQITIDTLKAPELLAPAFIFATQNRFPVNIETMTDCEVLIISKEHLLILMQKTPVVMNNFLNIISDRGLFLSKKLNEFALQSLKSRLLNYLQKHGNINNQQEVAYILGVARPSLSRALSELAHEGLISFNNKEILIVTNSQKK